MKVAIVTSFFPSAPAPHTGVPIFAQIPFLRQLADIQVICPRPAYPPIRVLQPRKHLYRHPVNGYDLPNVNAVHVPFYTFPVIGRAFNGYLSGRAALPAVRRFKPDVVLSYTIYPDGYGANWIARKLKVPSVVFAIGSDVRYIGDSVQRRLVQTTLRRADYVLTVSHELKARAIDLGADPQKARAILNGCDTSVFRPQDRLQARADLDVSPDRRLIVFVGRLVPLKGLRELFEALSTVRLDFPDVQLACVGEGPLQQELHDRAARPDLAGAVRFIPAATPPEVSNWMAAADLTVLPSYSEGCPNVVVESLACGRAVVASDVGGVPELVNAENGILITPRDAAGLARGLAEGLQRKWDTARIASTWTRSWNDVAKETIEICASVIRTGSK